jgi:hypothetical protein
MTRLSVLLLGLLPCALLHSQSVIAGVESGAVRLFPSDSAVFDLGEVKTSLPCTITPARVELGFDLVFHVGHTARLRLRDLAGDGNVLTSIFRVSPAANPGKPVYFEQMWRVPALPENAAGAVALESSFAVGDGDYQVDWLLRDNNERVCSAFWRISARLPIKDGHIAAGLPAGAVTAAGSDSGIEQAASGTSSTQRPSVTVLLNVGPDVTGGAAISQAQSDALLAMLRGILREPRIGDISVTAFNLEQRQVIFEQENIRQLNVPSLKRAIGALALGTVAVDQLAEKNAEAQFLVQLAAEKLKRRPSDVLIFVGPKTVDESSMNRELLQQLGDSRSPVFYLTYLPSPGLHPWRDLIGSAVHHLRGREFSISRPTDLVSAWSKIMSQLDAGSWPTPER